MRLEGALLDLDDVDYDILARLLRDGRASYREVGEAVGLSPSATKRRVDRLLEEGVIAHFAAVLEPRALGWTTDAFVEVFCEGTTPSTLIASTLSQYPEVVGAWTITGGPDAVIHLRTSDVPHLESVLDRIRSESFVNRTRSALVLSRLIERQIGSRELPYVSDGDGQRPSASQDDEV